MYKKIEIKLKKLILDYLYENDPEAKLRVLDNKYKTHYTGVTLRYITYNLLKAQYKKQHVARALLELHQDEEIQSLYCTDVQNYVFENANSIHWNFDPGTGDYDYKNVHNYLNNFIKW